MDYPEKGSTSRRFRLERRLPSYWRVTFDHPPINICSPETILQLGEVIGELETDEHVEGYCVGQLGA